MVGILNIIQKIFPDLVPKIRLLLYKLERVPKLPFDEPTKINIDDVSFKWWVKTRKDWWMASNRYTEKKQLRALIKAVKSHEKSCLWDIGAAQGIYTLTAVAAGATRVIAFEPFEQSFQALGNNVKLNNFTKRVTTLKIAIGKQTGHSLLFFGNACPSMFENTPGNASSTKINISTIDQLIKEGAPSPSIIKIDIEGYEFNALKGAKNLLSSSKKPSHLFIEIHDDFLKRIQKSHIDIFNLLETYGYSRNLTDEVKEGPRFLCHFVYTD